MFSSTTKANKAKFEISVEWHKSVSPILQKKIIKTHVASFLDLYQNYTANDLGLETGFSKEQWLTGMIQKELEDIEDGKILIASISVQDNFSGFVTCKPVKVRHEGYNEDYKNDVYINLLAVKSSCYLDLTKERERLKLPAKPLHHFNKTNETIRIGLGKQLMESVIARFTEANAIVLDTRHINESAIDFYKAIGFSIEDGHTFGGYNPRYYVGCEKVVNRAGFNLLR